MFARPLTAVLPLAAGLLAVAGCGAGSNLPPTDLGSPPDQAAAPRLRVANDRAYLGALEELLAGAQREVWAVHFELNRDAEGDRIVERLGGLARRGVKVHLLLEDSVAANGPRVQALAAAGVEAKLDGPSRYTHAKLVVVDGERALVGSTNWSASSLLRNHETNLLVDDRELAGWLDRYARLLFEAPTRSPELAPIRTASGESWGDGGYVPLVEPRLTEAKRRIELVVFGMNVDPRYPDSDVYRLIKRLGEARRRGVTVRVVLEAADYDPDITALNRQAALALIAEGVEARLELPTVITHAKLLLVDDAAAVGTNNWGHGGFRLYHEVGVMTGEAPAVQELGAYFEARWAEGRAP